MSMDESKQGGASSAGALQNISALIAGCTRGEDGWLRAEPSSAWMQGRSLYGGVQAALAELPLGCCLSHAASRSPIGRGHCSKTWASPQLID